MSTPKRRWRLSRRGFLIGVGTTGAGLALGYTIGLPRVRRSIAEGLEQGGGQPSRIDAQPQAWFEITPDDLVTFYSPKVEMGQGIHTALGQIAADELEIRWEQLRVRQTSTVVGPYDSSGTSGSFSVSSLYTIIRTAAATMREMLRTEAATQLGVAASAITMRNGAAQLTSDPARQMTYGAIVAGVKTWTVPKAAPTLKTPDQFTIIGKPMPRVDLPAKITGAAIYGYDMRVPGMLYGAIARPPTLGAKLKRAAAGDAATRPGVVQVVIDGDFVGVVASTRLQAGAALTGLELEWEPGPPIQQAAIEAAITVGQGVGVTIQEHGAGASQLGSTVYAAEYRTPMAAHAHLEPQAALADIRADGGRVWSSTQFPVLVRDAVAKAVGLKPEQIESTPTFLGGGFGRKAGTDVAVEAARLSKAVGKPVHVGWTRPEEFRHGYVRPPTQHILRADIQNGKIQSIEHQQASGHVAFDFLPAFLMQIFGADFGAWRGAMLPYAIPNISTVAWRNSLPIPTGWWRGLGLLANIFAVESFMDELAHQVGSDPFDFRLAHLPAGERGPRYQRMLTELRQRSNWDTPAAAGRARGMACCVDAGTVVGHVVEISQAQGQITVHHVTSVVDPGLAINPDGVIAQTQGSVVMGLGSTLLEELTINDSQVSASNFDGYPLMRLRDTPSIDVHVLSNGDTPHGMGEPAIGPVAAAVANAYFALSGTRLRRLPLRPEAG